MAKRRRPQRPARRRWFTIGPGLLMAVALSVYIAAQRGLFTKPRPPVVEHVGPEASDTPPAAEISFLLDRADQLHLTDAQRARLRALHDQWARATADQRAALDREQKELDRFMKSAQKVGKPTPLSEIQRRAGPISELSGQLASARRDYWERAMHVLDPDQRDAAEKALRDKLKLPPEPEGEKKPA
jgi:Spy/CpxP family protein refolding chaperone